MQFANLGVEVLAIAFLDKTVRLLRIHRLGFRLLVVLWRIFGLSLLDGRVPLVRRRFA